MLIKQLSVFLEDRSGRLTDLTQILAEHEINIAALSLAETADYGIVRMVVGKPDIAEKFLREAGFSVRLTDVVCVNMPTGRGLCMRCLRYWQTTRSMWITCTPFQTRRWHWRSSGPQISVKWSMCWKRTRWSCCARATSIRYNIMKRREL